MSELALFFKIEIGLVNLGPAINWIDKKYSMGYSNALDAFGKDRTKYSAAVTFMQTVKPWLREFCKVNKIDFIDNLKPNKFIGNADKSFDEGL